jgi:hypothetical protein
MSERARGSVEAIRIIPETVKIWSRPQTRIEKDQYFFDCSWKIFGSENYSGMKPRVAGSSPAERESVFSFIFQ